MTNHTHGVDKTRLNVLRLQPRISCYDRFRRVTRSEHTQYVLHSQTTAANDRFAAEDSVIYGDACEKVLL